MSAKRTCSAAPEDVSLQPVGAPTSLKQHKPIVTRSMTPKPPNMVGLVTHDQATVHQPPGAESEPVQTKERRILSIAWRIHGETSTVMEMCTGTAESVTFISGPAGFVHEVGLP
jgi:hypothetical protein